MPHRPDEVTDVHPSLLEAPNFPGVRLKPRLPPRGEAVARDGTHHLFKGANHDGVMVAIRLPHKVAEAVALPGGEDPSDLHLTLLYLGDASDYTTEQLNGLHDRVKAVCELTVPFSGVLTGYGRFDTGEDDVAWMGFDSPYLSELRHAVLQAAREEALEPAGDHGFTPHVSLGFADSPEQMVRWLTELENRVRREETYPLTVNFISVVTGGTEAMVRLRGEPEVPETQPVMPPGTFSELQRPKQVFRDVRPLQEWAEGNPALLVRPLVDGVGCVVAKRGRDVHVGVEGLPAEAHVMLADLAVAMRRIDHDYVLEGYLVARDLEGDWVGADRIGAVLDGSLVATPIFMPVDLTVLDGDLTKTSARDRWELLRFLVPDAGGHVVVPPQVGCDAPELEAAVGEATGWEPTEGQGLRVLGAVVVLADSPYVHGPSRSMALLDLSTEKGFGFGAGPGAGTERPGQVPDERRKPNFLGSTKKDVAPGTFGTDGTAGILAPAQGVFRRPRKAEGDNFGVGVSLTFVTDQPRQRRTGTMSPGPTWPTYERKYDEDEARDEHGRWASGPFENQPSIYENSKAHSRTLERAGWVGSGINPVSGGLNYKNDAQPKHRILIENDKSWLHLDEKSRLVSRGMSAGDLAEHLADRSTSSGVDPGTLKGSEINKELDALEADSSKNTDAFLAAGRGSEKPSDYLDKNDPLSSRARAIYDRQSVLRNEIANRYGPNHPARVPTGIWSKPRIKKDGGNVGGGGTGDGDSTGAPAFGSHTFVVGELRDGEVVPGKLRRVNPYEAIFQRPGWVGRRKPDKYPGLGADMGFADVYDAKALYLTKEDVGGPAPEPLYLSEDDLQGPKPPTPDGTLLEKASDLGRIEVAVAAGVGQITTALERVGDALTPVLAGPAATPVLAPEPRRPVRVRRDVVRDAQGRIETVIETPEYE
jgi:2'-5' RNA ligase